MKIEFSPQMFEKCWNIKFNEIPSSWRRAVARGQTDGRTDKANRRFPQFCRRAYKRNNCRIKSWADVETQVNSRVSGKGTRCFLYSALKNFGRFYFPGHNTSAPPGALSVGNFSDTSAMQAICVQHAISVRNVRPALHPPPLHFVKQHSKKYDVRFFTFFPNIRLQRSLRLRNNVIR